MTKVDHAKLLALAERMQAKIDHKLFSGTASQKPTARRLRMIEHAQKIGLRLLKTQSAIRAFAEAVRDGSTPESLMGITRKSQVEILVRNSVMPSEINEPDAYKDLARAGIQTPEAFDLARADLLRLIPPSDGEIEKRLRIGNLEREVAMRKIPDFFPTPRWIILQMVAELDLKPWPLRILEPEAGSAAILDELVRVTNDLHTIHCCEINCDLNELLRLKGYEVVASDFLTYWPQEPFYDRIIMNPPFAGMAEIEHIRHAYDLLAPGGRLVSITSQSPFHQSVRRAVEFRRWLESLPHEVIELPDGAFKNSARPTGVSTSMVVIDKGFAAAMAADLPELAEALAA